jgi:hypothetical protein
VVGTFVYMVIARRDRQWPFRPLENLT